MPKTKIMIVEDERPLAMLMELKLNYLGCEICKLVSTGEDAIKSVEQEQPDIVLMDIILNGKMDGIEAAREIRSRYDIPIIFTTGCDDRVTRALAEEVGPIAYFIKPVEIEDLMLVIYKTLYS